MFPVILMQMMAKPVRVKTVGSFEAEDPWNQNQRTTFTIEGYVLLPKGSKPNKFNTMTLGGQYLYGIRSEVDGVERMLPESLVVLWQKNRIAPEALARLLKQMSPMLRKSDWRRPVLNKRFTVLQYVFVFAFAILIVALAGVVFSDASSSSEVASAAMTVAVVMAFGGGMLYLVFLRPRARRKRQMDWVLAHV